MAIDVKHGERTATRAAEAGAEPRSAVSGGAIVEARSVEKRYDTGEVRSRPSAV